MNTHSNHFDYAVVCFAVDLNGFPAGLVDEPTLDADSTRAIAQEIADKRFVRRRVGERVGLDHLNKMLGLLIKPRC